MIKKYFFSVVISIFFSISADGRSSDCVVSVNREPCSGREAEAWYPYQGQNPTTHSVQVTDQVKCSAAARRIAAIARKGVLKRVTATPSFTGSVLDPAVSQSTCESSERGKKRSASDMRLNKGVVFQESAERK